MMAPAAAPPGFFARWAAYFSERFPPLQYAAALGVFTFATLAYRAAGAGVATFPGAYPAFVGFAVAFLTFLQLRIHDEFKDFDEDSRYRPERPVPRGLVTLESLARLGLFAAGIQFALSATLGVPLVAMLVVILAYSWLMRVEFFARAWLKAHAGAYLLSHMMIIPLIAIYIAMCSGTGDVLEPLGPYLVFSYFNFCVFEIGRKVWAPEEERPGVETYTALWGRDRAVAAWLGAIYLAAAAGMVAAQRVGVGMPYGATALAIGLPATAVGVWFLRDPARVKGRWFRALSALWFLAIHLALGAAIVHGF